MGKIMTVLGEIDSNDLGFTSMHDHILVDTSYYNDIYGAIIPNIGEEKLVVRCQNITYLKKGYFGLSHDSLCLDDVDLASEEISYFKNAGGSSILEVSPGGIRGNIEDMKKVSENTGVNIIVSAGYYGEGSWPEGFVYKSIDELQAHIEKEIYEGIDGTDIKAGHVKIACNSLSETEEKALRAGARAAKKAGLTITVHTGLGMPFSDTIKMAKIVVEEEGVNPKKVVMAHVDQYILKTLDLKEYILNHESATELQIDEVKILLDMGVTISFDTFGATWGLEVIGKYLLNDYDRIRGLLPLIQAGYSKQIVLGTDMFVKFCYRKYGGDGYAAILESIIPLLKMFEVSDEDIQNMTVNNPARLLEY